MSVRLRLTLWYASLLGLALTIFAAAVVWQTDRAARADLSRLLDQRARDVAADLRFRPAIVLRPDAPDDSGARLGEATLWIRVLDAAGRPALRQGPPLAGLPASLLTRTTPGLVDEEVAGDRRVLILIEPIRRGGRRVATLQLITTTDAIDAQRRQLLVAMALAGACLVGLAIAGGIFLADRALRPVAGITALAARIGAGDLHRRVRDELGSGHGARRDELGRLVTTFDGMLARLEVAAEQRRGLTADVAHELGTPMATIHACAEVTLARNRRPDEYRAALHSILAESGYAARVLDDLLLLGRADAGRLPMQRELVEIDEVCRQAMHAVRLPARARGIEARLELPAHPVLVWGDETRLAQVLRNLLDNALRHTPDGGAIRVSLRHGQAGERTIILEVADSGPGIPEDEAGHIFERYYRITGAPESALPGRPGNGLGLAICKAIVIAHDGTIAVMPETAGGANFVVTLPDAAEIDALRQQQASSVLPPTLSAGSQEDAM